MADDEGFLGRWSRRKQAQKEQAAPAEAPKLSAPPDTTAGQPKTAPPEPTQVDLASLPPIESLGAESDYTDFLRPGVPQSMQLAALRRLWLTDPSVRNYEALVDYAWDFNAPGYGQMLPTDDVEKLLKAVFGEREKPRETENIPAEPVPANVSEPPKIAAQHDAVRRSDVAPPRVVPTMVQDTALPAPEPAAAETSAPATRRRHGAALPQPPVPPDEG